MRLLCAWLLGVSALMGCSSGSTLNQRVAQLQDELVALQNKNDRLEERILGLENLQAQGKAVKPATKEETIERPPLKVVHLGPNNPNNPDSPRENNVAPAQASEPEAAPSEPDQIRVIRGAGNRVESRLEPVGKVEKTPPKTATPPVKPKGIAVKGQ